MPQNSLNPSMTSIKSLPFSHFIWFFKTKFITHMNSCKTRWIVNFLIVNNLEQCKYLDTCANLYKLQATQILMGTTIWNFVFFFSMKGFNFFVKWWTKNLLAWKCLIHLRLLYYFIKKFEYKVVDHTLTYSLSFLLFKISYTHVI